MATAYHMVNYRHFEQQPPASPGVTLEHLCRSALGVTDAAGLRLWDRAQDRLFVSSEVAGRQILVNRVADLSSAVFGEMCLIQSDDLQPLLELTPSNVQLSNITMAQVFGLAERSAPQGSQFVRGMAYWLATGDHLFFVRTHAMNPDHIRGYLSWLLQTQTATLPTVASFKLQAQLDKAQFDGDIGDIKKMRVSGKTAPHLSVTTPAGEPVSRTAQTTRKIADKFVEFEQAVPVVKALFGGPKTEELISSLGKQEYLAVDASVKVKGRRTPESKAKLREIVTELADMTDAKVQIDGRDGTVTDGDAILRTKMPFDLPYEGSNLLDFDNVSDQLQEVYSRYVKDGKIAA